MTVFEMVKYMPGSWRVFTAAKTEEPTTQNMHPMMDLHLPLISTGPRRWRVVDLKLLVYHSYTKTAGVHRTLECVPRNVPATCTGGGSHASSGLRHTRQRYLATCRS
jgi:hypothetical protein